MKRNSQGAGEQGRVRKVRVNICLDEDVVDYFKGRARVPGAAAYQTQINAELRRLMQGGAGAGFAALVEDDRFIAALAERLGLKAKGRAGQKGNAR